MSSRLRVSGAWIALVAALLVCIVVPGCQNSGGVSGTGTLAGGLLGAGIGYGIGGGKGALIGGLVGAALGTIIEAAINESARKAAQTGRPAVAVSTDHGVHQRVESYPVARTADGQHMRVMTVVYEEKTTATGQKTWARAEKNGKPVPVVMTEVPATNSAGIAEDVREGKPKVVYGEDIQATAKAGTDASGRTVYTIEKNSPTGRETIVYNDSEWQASAGSSGGRGRD
ncbi:MAG: hypothetical protein HYZ53_25955 [Planctomycetes bacterium]|nr:hypothetical protein [Planctomycetota bacterium]